MEPLRDVGRGNLEVLLRVERVVDLVQVEELLQVARLGIWLGLNFVRLAEDILSLPQPVLVQLDRLFHLHPLLLHLRVLLNLLRFELGLVLRFYQHRGPLEP